MSQPDYKSVHVNRPLTNISVAYIQEQDAFVADKVFPNIGSKNVSDTYFKYPKGYFYRDQVKERAPGTAAEQVGYEIEQDSYICKSYALAHAIPDELRANQDSPLDADRDGAQLLVGLGYIKREKLWAAAAFTTGKWALDVTCNTSASDYANNTIRQWSHADSTPLQDIAYYQQYMLQRTGKKFGTAVMGRAVWTYLKNHTQILNRVLYGGTNGSPAVVTKQLVAALLEVDEVLVSEAIENTAAEGQADNFQFILGKHLLLCHRTRSPGIRQATAGYTFSWTGMYGMTDAGWRMSKYRDTPRKSDVIDMDMYMTHKIVATDLGIFFNGIVA